jgi:predicted outer membrane repeat protein
MASSALAVEFEVHPGENIQAKLDQAGSGDVVVLHPGIYQQGGLTLSEGVTLRSQSGDPATVMVLTDGSETALSLFQVSGATRIEGITFARSPEHLDGYVDRGGAAVLREASPNFLDCRFENFEAVYGGAVYCADGSNPIFTDCVFRRNKARAVGGAIACVNDCELLLENCIVYENEAGSAGGAFNMARNSHVGLMRTTVARNSTSEGAAAAGWSQSYVVAVASIVSDADILAGDSDSLYKPDCSNIFDGSGEPPVDPGFGYYISEDPLFCLTLAGDHKFNLDEASPCTPEAEPDCGGMGALPVGCAQAPVPGPLPIRVTRVNEIYPNPFNPQTTIKYDLARQGRVSVAVFDLAGRLVHQLLDESVAPGHHEVTWRGRDSRGRTAAAGVYFVRLKTADTTDTRRMTLVK